MTFIINQIKIYNIDGKNSFNKKSCFKKQLKIRFFYFINVKYDNFLKKF